MFIGAFGQAQNCARVMVCGVLAGLAAGCGVADERYAGGVVVTEGACGLGFDAQGHATATLVIRGADVQFAPSDGVTVLDGHLTGTGHVLAGSSALGADKKPFVVVFEGEREGNRVRGRYATPRCRAMVELSRR